MSIPRPARGQAPAHTSLRPGVEVRLQEAPYEDEPGAMVERGSLDFTFALARPRAPSSTSSGSGIPNYS